VIDNWTRQRRGEYFFALGSVEERGIYHLQANKSHEIYVEFCNVCGPADGDENETVMDTSPGVRLGGAEVRNSDDLINQAVELAREADIVIAVVGLNADFETEGYDRKTLALPGPTDELIQKVAEVNKNTIVVTQAGSAITMPWVDAVPSIVHAWYLGNATGDAIAQVLLGHVNPAGRLSLTFPKRLEDVPSYASFSLENGKVRYSEGLLVVCPTRRSTFLVRSGKALSVILFFFPISHRATSTITRSVSSPFSTSGKGEVLSSPGQRFLISDCSHGLSYTSFQYSDLKLSEPTYTDGDINVTATLTLTNTGSVTGSEVVQLYVTLPTTAEYTHPPLQLKGFKKVKDLKADGSETVTLELDKYAVSYWDEKYSTWNVDRGAYTVRIGGSSAEGSLTLSSQFEIPKSFTWNGL
jgi:beta-glucosidase